MSRDEWLTALPSVETRSLACEVQEERVYGHVGVARARLSWDASVGGRDLSGEYAVTDVFTHDGRRWRASWRVSVRLPEGA